MADSNAPGTEPPVIERIECESPHQLLDFLSPRHKLWVQRSDSWVFRGQSEDWPLRAKADRDSSWRREFQVHDGYQHVPVNASWGENPAVSLLLATFSHLLNTAGLPLPHPAPRVFNVLELGAPGLLTLHPDAMPLMALAQHFGLPTPFLDWSTFPRSAAYFACSDLVWKPETFGPMVVWALNKDFVQTFTTTRPMGVVDGVSLTFETAPRADNPRLHAQSGLFTWLHGEETRKATIDGHVSALAASGEAVIPYQLGFRPPYMRCFTLDRCFAPHLMKLLAEEGTTGASIYPGYEGVVRGMRERAWFSASPNVREQGLATARPNSAR